MANRRQNDENGAKTDHPKGPDKTHRWAVQVNFAKLEQRHDTVLVSLQRRVLRVLLFHVGEFVRHPVAVVNLVREDPIVANLGNRVEATVAKVDEHEQ